MDHKYADFAVEKAVELLSVDSHCLSPRHVRVFCVDFSVDKYFIYSHIILPCELSVLFFKCHLRRQFLEALGLYGQINQTDKQPDAS